MPIRTTLRSDSEPDDSPARGAETLCRTAATVGAPPAHHLGHVQGLGHDLTGRKIARKSHLSGRAEHAPQGTAGLRAETSRRATPGVHQHCFDPNAVVQGEQVFVGQPVVAASFAGER